MTLSADFSPSCSDLSGVCVGRRDNNKIIIDKANCTFKV